jgi:hypothetical protein
MQFTPRAITASQRWLYWVETATTFVALAAALGYLWWGWCQFPLHEWNELRLAPAFALRHGITLYPEMYGGPLSTWIYGPTGAALNLPATFARSAVGAIEIAAFLNLATLVLPVCMVAFSLRTGTASAWRNWSMAVSLTILLLPATSLTFQVADHAAIACGLVSCACLTRERSPQRVQLAIAAALAILSFWSKQSAALLPLAQLAYLLFERDRTTLVRYVRWLVVLGAISLGLAAVVFHWAGLRLNLVDLPARLPWGNFNEKLMLRWPSLLSMIVLPLTILTLLHRRRVLPERDSAAGRLLRCCTSAFFGLLPLGLLAFFKIGGDINLLHSPFYLFPAIVLSVVTRAKGDERRGGWLAAAAVALVLLRLPQITALPLGPLTQHVAAAERYARAHPAAVWFPYNPVVTFYTDATLYHVEDGIATRHLAGYGMRERQFHTHLPPWLSAVVYPAGVQYPFALQLLGEFNQRTEQGPWVIYERTVPR